MRGIFKLLCEFFQREFWLKFTLFCTSILIAMMVGGVVRNGMGLGYIIAVGPLTIIVGTSGLRFMRYLRRLVMSEGGKLAYLVGTTAAAYAAEPGTLTGLVAMAYAVMAKVWVLGMFEWFYKKERPLTMAEFKGDILLLLAKVCRGLAHLLGVKA